jgi:hypothetical protein
MDLPHLVISKKGPMLKHLAFCLHHVTAIAVNIRAETTGAYFTSIVPHSSVLLLP